MPKKKVKNEKGKKSFQIEHMDLLHEVIMVCVLAIGFILAVSVYTEQAGAIGLFLQKLNLGLLGFAAYLLPIMIIVYSTLILFRRLTDKNNWKIYVVLGLLIIISTFVHVLSAMTPADGLTEHIRHYYEVGAWSNGGVIGGVLGDSLLKIVGIYGTYIILFALSIVCFVLLTERSFIKDIMAIGRIIHDFILKMIHGYKAYRQKNREITNTINKKHKTVIGSETDVKEKTSMNAKQSEEKMEEQEEKPIKIMDFMQSAIPNQKSAILKEEVQKQPSVDSKEKEDNGTEQSIEKISSMGTKLEYTYPSIELLQQNNTKPTGSSKNQILQNAKKLEKTLESFGVNAKVLQVSRGPTVTRYELQPSQGVKVSKIVNLADDIALNLAAAGIRIEAPIPGKAAVGIEVPNSEVQSVFLREVIEDEHFHKFPSRLAFALGKDISGNVVVTDIAKMPHLLIAGATGSGKSVCINTLITSIIYKANPNEVKLLMIDPKVVELSVYNGIPHLMIPVVTDPKKAASALNWAVQEMIQRYKLFADNNVRDIKGYNNMKEEKQEEDKMSQIVIIIDELADLMMAAPGDVEDAICRLAQMARAAGIHLVIATQRPSVDVITGVIKANIPSRLAFAVSSGTDSRTILDMNGAEKLLGKGDMLFYPVGAQKPIRIQGAFISDKEVESIVDFVKKDQEAEYNEEMIDEITAVKNMPDANEEVDEYLSQAIELVIDKEKASISMLQRSFRIGFNRAARIMEELEARGIVGPEEGSKPRRVLVSMEELEAMKQEA